jgi:heme-degrading monooxygenase HmoA
MPPGPITLRNEEHRHDRDRVSLPPAAGLSRRIRGARQPHERDRHDDARLHLARERVTIVEFEHEEGMRAWRMNPEHRAAQKLAREKFYSEYHIQVCTVDRQSSFKAVEEPAAAQG